MRQNTTRLRMDVVCVSVLILAALGVGLPRFLDDVNLADEGFLAYGAERVLRGEVPHRDFESLQPPLSFYTVALAFGLFGTSLVTLRGFGLALYVLIPVGVYVVGRYGSRPVLALAAASPALLFGMPTFGFVPFAAWQGLGATLVTALAVLGIGNQGRRVPALLAGAGTACAGLFRHDQGVYLALATGVYCLALIAAGRGPTARRVATYWTAGMVALGLPVALFWIVAGAFEEVVDQLVVFPLTTYPETSSLPMPRFALTGGVMRHFLVALFYVPAVGAAATAGFVVRRFARGVPGDRDLSLTFVTALTGMFYVQVLTRSDLFHMLITLPPLFVLSAWWLESLARIRASRAGVALAVGVTIAWWSVVFLASAPLLVKPLEPPVREIALERAGVRVQSRRADAIERVIATVRQHAPEDRSILCLPYCPMVYFLAERRNPTRWNYLWRGDQTAEDHRKLVREAQDDPPAVIVVVEPETFGSDAPEIMEYVTERYRREESEGAFGVYLPGAPPSGGDPP